MVATGLHGAFALSTCPPKNKKRKRLQDTLPSEHYLEPPPERGLSVNQHAPLKGREVPGSWFRAGFFALIRLIIYTTEREGVSMAQETNYIDETIAALEAWHDRIGASIETLRYMRAQGPGLPSVHPPASGR